MVSSVPEGAAEAASEPRALLHSAAGSALASALDAADSIACWSLMRESPVLVVHQLLTMRGYQLVTIPRGSQREAVLGGERLQRRLRARADMLDHFRRRQAAEPRGADRIFSARQTEQETRRE